MYWVIPSARHMGPNPDSGTGMTTFERAGTAGPGRHAAPAECRTLMFSATVPRAIATLAKKYQRDAVWISMASEREQHKGRTKLVPRFAISI